MIAVDLIARWLHIIPAITLVGGTIFVRFALTPSVNHLSEKSDEFQADVRRRWSKLIALSALCLLLSGFYNAANAAMNYDMTGDLARLYNPLLGVKLLGALGVFYIASLLAGRSEAAEKFRQKESMWLNVNVLLTLLLVCVAGAMKVTEREPKADEEDEAEARLVAPLEPGARG